MLIKSNLSNFAVAYARARAFAHGGLTSELMANNSIEASNKRTSIVNRNIIGSLAVKGFSVAISLLLVPLTLDYTSSEMYGIWLTLSSFLLWFGFLDIGLWQGLRNRLTEALALNLNERARQLVSTTYGCMLLIFIPVCVVFELLVPMINWSALLNVNQVYEHELQNAMHIVILCFTMQIALGVVNAVLSAYQKTALSSSLIVIGNFLSLATIFILKYISEPSLLLLSIAMALPPVIVLLVTSLILYSSKQFLSVRPSLKFFRKEMIADILTLGVKFFILQIQVLVVTSATNFFIAQVSNPDEVTSYNIAYRYLGIVFMLFGIMLAPLWPAFTDAYAKEDYEWMKATYNKMQRFAVIAIVAEIILLLIAPTVYNLWIGDGAHISVAMNLAVAVFIIMQIWSQLQITLINGIGKISLQTIFAVVVSVLHIPLSFALGNIYGGVGVVISLAVVYMIYSVFSTFQLHLILNRRATGIIDR